MIHGNTKMELSYESVHEALEEWLQGHLASNVRVKLSKWALTTNAQYGMSQTISIEFSQEPTPDKSTENPLGRDP